MCAEKGFLFFAKIPIYVFRPVEPYVGIFIFLGNYPEKKPATEPYVRGKRIFLALYAEKVLEAQGCQQIRSPKNPVTFSLHTNAEKSDTLKDYNFRHIHQN